MSESGGRAVTATDDELAAKKAALHSDLLKLVFLGVGSLIGLGIIWGLDSAAEWALHAHHDVLGFALLALALGAAGGTILFALVAAFGGRRRDCR